MDIVIKNMMATTFKIKFDVFDLTWYHYLGKEEEETNDCHSKNDMLHILQKDVQLTSRALFISFSFVQKSVHFFVFLS